MAKVEDASTPFSLESDVLNLAAKPDEWTQLSIIELWKGYLSTEPFHKRSNVFPAFSHYSALEIEKSPL